MSFLISMSTTFFHLIFREHRPASSVRVHEVRSVLLVLSSHVNISIFCVEPVTQMNSFYDVTICKDNCTRFKNMDTTETAII